MRTYTSFLVRKFGGKYMATRKKKGKKKGNQQEGLKFAIVVLSALILLLVIYLIQRVQKENRATPTDAPTPTTMVLNTGTPAPTSGTPVKDTPTAIPTETPTPAPTAATPTTEAPTMTPEPTPTPEPTKEVTLINENEALALLEKKISKDQYLASLQNDNLKIDGTKYYLFSIQEKGSTKVYPLFVAVNGVNGELSYYDGERLLEFLKFPQDSASAGDPEKPPVNASITAKQAYDLLCTMNKDDLLLAKNPSEYEAEYSDEISFERNGKDCYTITLFETSNGKKRNRGEFFISVDGLDCYYYDADLEDFVLVPIG